MGSDFGEWTPPGRKVVNALTDFSPQALSELRAYYEAVDPLRVNVANVIGQAEYLERLDVDSSVFSVSDDGTEQVIYFYDIPAGLLQTEGAIEVKIGGTLLNNSGASRTITVKIMYGNDVIWEDDSENISASANTRGFGLEFVFGNAAATDSQKLAGKIGLSSSTAPATGYGTFALGLMPYVPIGGVATEDSTILQRLSVKVTLSTAHPSFTFTKEYAYTSRIAH